MAMRFGTHPVLEAAANQILRDSMRGITSIAAKSDILTPKKERMRGEREVLSSTGVVEPTSRRGIYYRDANPSRPDLNSREGVMRPPPRGMSTLEQFVRENGNFNEGGEWSFAPS